MSFCGYFYTCCFENDSTSSQSTTFLQFTASLCHWIIYKGVLVLDTTIINGWHCKYDRLWYSTFWVEMLRWKMTISREAGGSRRRLNMRRDHNNMVEEDTSIWFEREDLFLLQTLDLFVWRTIRTKCNNRHFSATKAPMTKPEHTPSLARHSR